MDAEAPGRAGKAQAFPYWLITFDGTRLRKRRLERGLSQDRLAYHSGVSLKNIQRVEKLPAASCRAATLRQLAAALSDDPDTLIRELTQGFAASPEKAREARQRPQRRRGGQWWHQARPFPASRTQQGRYDAALARELLAMTGEFPDTKGGLLILLTEYRRALQDIAAGPLGKSS